MRRMNMVVDVDRPEFRRIDFPYGYAARHFFRILQEGMHSRHRQFDERMITDYQDRALRRLIAHAYASCPYYTNLLDKLQLRPDDIAHLSDLARLPILTRHDLQEHFYDLCSDQADLHYCYVKHTSGSTGEPIRVVLDYLNTMQSHVLLLNHARPYGLQLNHFRPLCTGILFVTGFQESTSQTYLQPHFNFSRFYKLNIDSAKWVSQSDMIRYIRALRPVVITGLPEHVALLQHAVDVQIPRVSLRPRLVVVSGNRLDPSDQAVFETSFHAPVLDIYAMTEVGYVASACVTGSGYHVDDSIIVEVVSPDGRPAPTGELGEIVITSLRNKAMPLIRYRTGDLGRMAVQHCRCGSQWPLLQAIEGRINELFLRPDGSFLHPFVFIRRLQRLPLTQYQVVQQSVFNVLVQYVAREDSEELAVQVTNAVSSVLDPEVNVQIQRVAAIGEPGRKIQNFVSHLDTPREV